MKKIVLISVLLLFVLIDLFSQRRNGLIGHRRTQGSGLFTVAMGPSYCFDDPYGTDFSKSFFSGHDYQLALGYLSSIKNSDFWYRVQLHYANYKGDDGSSSHQTGARYYSYLSNVFQLSARGEYSVKFGERFKRKMPNSVYGFLGLGVLNSTVKYPQSSNNTNNFPLFEGKTTPSLALFIPVGIGYMYELNPKSSIGVELTNQIIFSDKVDGYEGSHITGVPIVNDHIQSLTFTYYYNLF